MQETAKRGQTTQDYLTGVSVLLLVLVAVFTFVPGVFTPFEEPVETAQRSQADALATEILATASAPGAETTLDESELSEPNGESVFDDADRYEALERRAGIPARAQTNVTLLAPDDWDQAAAASADDTYDSDSQTAAQRVRVVTFERDDTCDPACRLVVRVWKDT